MHNLGFWIFGVTNLLGNIKIFPSWNPIFLAWNPIFLSGFPTFFNGFLLSLTAFCFLQQLSDFPWQLSAFQEIQENLSTAASIRKITIRASYFPPLPPQVLEFPLQCLHLPNTNGKKGNGVPIAAQRCFWSEVRLTLFTSILFSHCSISALWRDEFWIATESKLSAVSL